MAKIVSLKKPIKEANKAEQREDISLAIKEYEEAIQKDPLAEKVYDRLMILYRKEKDHSKELKLINACIKSFETFYRSKKSRSKKIADISNKLNKSFGFTDKKGNTVYDPEPIARWKKRKITVEKRIKK
jgi:tetratricopeptide (TPR) repeat protein